MMVLVSDLHLTDERTANNVNPEAFKLFADGVAATARKRGAQETVLVLLGDIFDLVRSDLWHRENIPSDQRPWGGELDPETAMNRDSSAIERQFLTVLHGILGTPTARQLRATLAELQQTCPAFSVRYVVGNHDRVLWNFPALRAAIQEALPQISGFSTSIESEEYGVIARHGHEWDINCHGWEFRNKVLLPRESVSRFSLESYRVMAIGEAVTAELLAGLIYHAAELGTPASILEQLKDVNNLRPMLHVFEWLDWIGAPESREEQKRLYEALRRALDGLLGCSLAQRWDRMRTDLLVSADLIDRLQQARTLVLGPNFGSFRGRVGGLKRLERFFPFLFREEDILREGARSEEVFRNPRPGHGIQRIVYGHTHRARHDYFHGNQDGTVQMYINTGTYLPLITEAEDGESFASSMQMVYVYLYRVDEDLDTKQPGTMSLDVWTGIRRKVYTATARLERDRASAASSGA
jgi:UDP-2,3-diacylglucosamine pyrophosphatase LpxH